MAQRDEVESSVTPSTFIERHGLIRYDGHALRSLPRPRWCEICRSPKHVTYQLDHCHVHDWVRGVLCGVCNQQMRRVDRGQVPLVSPYVEHWRLCPDCRELGVVSPQPSPRPQGQRRRPCVVCGDSRVFWLTSIYRMVPCPLCRHSASRAAVREAVTQSDKSAERPHLKIVTERDQNGAPASERGRAHAFSANFVRASLPGSSDGSDTCSPSVS